ncbi:MAG: hybrid sensor histidine kinase/response regulator [Telluria sp.]
MRENDWSASPLGHPDTWPRELLTVVNLMLNSNFPMFVAWGPELGFLYNDAYAPMLGNKLPGSMGVRFQDLWREIWDDVGPIVSSALEGNSSYFENFPLMVLRTGQMEKAWFTFSYSPVEDAQGNVAGMYCSAIETTSQVLIEKRQAFQLELANKLGPLGSAEEIIAESSAILGRYLEVSRVAYCEIDDLNGTFVVRRDWTQHGLSSVAGPVRRLDDFGPGVINDLRAGKLMIVPDVLLDARTAPHAAAYDQIGARATLALPLVKAGRLTSVLTMHHHEPHVWNAEDIRLAAEMAERTWSTVDNARAQAELRDANRRKDEFLAMLAHELRNPLAPISAAAELMQISMPDPELVRRTSQVISRQVRHMTGLVDDLLDVSRVTRGLVQINKLPQEMRHIIDNAVEQVRPLIEARRHRLVLEAAPQHAVVEGDENRLVQVVTNLLNNAAKYTPEGGVIRVVTEVRDNDVIVSVEDNGIGMQQELQPRVFDLFSQAERTSDRAQGGLGLGLALVKSLVELHGGAVSCFSEGADMGSRFILRLPVAPQADAAAVDSSSHLQDAGDQCHCVLVVDDNADAAEMLSMLLEASGHRVLVENAPGSAITTAATALPSACLLDIGLPGMDGYELARRLRALPGMENALLVAVTGYGQDADRRKAVEAGFDNYLVKPVDLEQLLDILGEKGRR